VLTGYCHRRNKADAAVAYNLTTVPWWVNADLKQQLSSGRLIASALLPKRQFLGCAMLQDECLEFLLVLT